MNILSSTGPDYLADVAEPTDAELIAIEMEWPSIEADLILLDTELAQLPGSIPVRRTMRRRRRRVLAAMDFVGVSS